MKTNLLLISLLILGVFPVTVIGQPLFFSVDSIDLMMADGQAVAIGTLGEIDASQKRDDYGLNGVEFVITEMLKGKPCKRLTVRLNIMVEELQRMKAAGSRFLIVDRNCPIDDRAINLSDTGKIEVLTADFTVLRSAKEVIAAAREAIRRTPMVGNSPSFRLSVPYEIAATTKWKGCHGLSIHVPIDRRLEVRAYKMIESDMLLDRSDAIKALAHFKSPRAIAAIRTQLTDPAYAYHTHAIHNDGVEIRVYLTRREAYQLLKRWGVEVEKPVIKESVRVKE